MHENYLLGLQALLYDAEIKKGNLDALGKPLAEYLQMKELNQPDIYVVEQILIEHFKQSQKREPSF